MSPAADPSIAFAAVDPPSPINLIEPKVSELIVTEWLSNGEVPSQRWSITNDRETDKPLSNSPPPENVNWLPIV